MACGANTDMNLVTTLWNQAEGFVKGGDMLNPGQWNIQSLGDPFQRLFGKPIILGLYIQ
jgi:hypothetical protein